MIYSIRMGDKQDDFGELIEFNNDSTANVFLSNQFTDFVFFGQCINIHDDKREWAENMREKLKINNMTFNMLCNVRQQRYIFFDKFVRSRDNWICNVPIINNFCGNHDLSKKIEVKSVFDKVNMKYYENGMMLYE